MKSTKKTMKKLATSDDVDIVITPPFTLDIMNIRDNDYFKDTDTQFCKKYRKYLYEPVYINIKGERNEIQFNKCSNPFCGRYGQSQKKYLNLPRKPSRYKIVSSSNKIGEYFQTTQNLSCNIIENEPDVDRVIEHRTQCISNWSVAEEIKRLITINSVTPIEPEYVFHKEECSCKDITPFDTPKGFYNRGKSSSNSPKYQCKECKKITNVRPRQNESYNYHQKRNDLLFDFTKDILGRSPVKRTCEKLGIAAGTYYNKLEWVYRKCLEFLERHETEKLNTFEFDELYLNTDMFNYNLNNIKLKGRGGKKSVGRLDKKLATSVIASCDLKSGYVFRTDVAYDFTITMEQIEEDTIKYHCDHSYNFIRKNGRLKYPFAPQHPTPKDSQTKDEYLKELEEFEIRKNYIEGVHVKTPYTAIAHYFLINKMLNIQKNIYFISDNDATLQFAVHKVFNDNFLNNKAIYFTNQVNKSFTLEEAGSRYFQQRRELIQWGKEACPNVSGISNIAYEKLLSDLKTHSFFDYKVINGIEYPYRSKRTINHPLPFKDEGERYINVVSPLNNVSDSELANIIIKVNSRAIDNYFQSIRRKLSILERPLVTSRGDGKSYIYANYNPKYAQYMLTIFRTVYNFCLPQGSSKENKKTPAMSLGISNKFYTLKDIIYFK